MIVQRTPQFAVFQSALYQTNSLVVHHAGAVVVFDPGTLPHEVEEIRAYTEAVRDGRPLHLVYTHGDWDHVIGDAAFPAARRVASVAFGQRDTDAVLGELQDFDATYYLRRPYPLRYPQADLEVRGGEVLDLDGLRLRFFAAPGHTPDGLVTLVEPLGLLVAGDYLADVEFPFVHNSAAYLETLRMFAQLFSGGAVSLLVPGHGRPTGDLEEMQARQREALAYLRALRAAVQGGDPAEPERLIAHSPFLRATRAEHERNLERARAEFAQG
ncbi:glyoxylase-like metal-dependent hydrolase (beta-lactamase superfamily II) [Deinobacterium chartae]|uniref:Glyoxylase-like metal-dependent hydrolase (Beta-lactamase superfamily II) n=1 Tax=Deinobacterium chartae TaxID=521158 RepID=A0A841HWX7_9DEIO|nr:glyoxylase-like metal-dependent hydrolase (beta-lactamase superfamily II) [Deinobacterium chartae]